MHRSGLWRFAVPYLALIYPASAQVVWDMPGIVVPKVNIDRAPPPARLDVWPRLDPGAVICKTQGDLQRLAEARRGVAGERPKCQLIQTPTAVAIVKRAGPGQTEVTLTNQNSLDSWTDAYLPDRALPPGGQAVQIK
jgi:hypothetical protein